MVSLRSIATAIAGVALLVESSLARSVKRNAVNYISFIDEPVINTPSHHVRADSHFDLLFSLHNGQQKIRLKLEPNHDILHENFAITHIGADGSVRSGETVKREDDKVFKGAAFIQRIGREGWTKAGWARITIHRDGKAPVFEGTLRIDGNHHHIHTGTNFQQVRHEDDPILSDREHSDEVMVVWRDSDVMSFNPNELKKREASAALCNSDTLGFNSKFHELQDFDTFGAAKTKSLFGRQSIDTGSTGDDGTNVDLEEHIGSVTGCPTSRRVALLGIATDCGYTAKFNSSEALRKSVIRMVNDASEVYEKTFNITLGIQNLTISDESCPGSPSDSAAWNQKCSDSVDLSERLNLFSSWRGQSEDTNAYWTLLSTCNTDSAVGLAWLGQLCRPGASANSNGGGRNETVAGANVVVRTSAEWQVFAHETGHTFGAVHDCTESTCPVSSDSQGCCPLSKSSCDAKGDFIMNPSSREGISEFSPCSIGNICSGFRRNVNTECLTDNRNVKTISGQQCGNGIVEEGEDCDCGGEDSCGDNPCCDPKTCKFKGKAECDNSNEECCTDECKFSSSGTVCRDSTGPCDPEEKCSGSSATCPKDAHSNDGDDCGDGLQCASGQCTSRDEQCRANYQNTTSSSSVKACTNSCLLSCQASDEGFCTQRNQNFLDGTPCGGGGHCDNGNCEGASTWKEIENWFQNNKKIAIPVGCVLAVLLVLAVSCCLWSCIRRRLNRRKVAKQPAMGAWPGYAPGYPRGPGPNNGPQGGYTYAPLDNNNGWQGRTRSMRYA
ncbi:hypothetical protein FSARC_11821 [Fusarium sarcochroum]|uniref:Disintegrin and metalloproteinase domain-containing protein B n=1 Tax=Fusarium sarcochroum TaxID=1208366 RepID=A0A8H4TCU5_9HYPO|nr:hypothetical protein FSARC_11821 [Fusarium sarcochroum]